MNFLCITEPSVPEITLTCLRGACEARDIAYFEIAPEDFPFDAADKAGKGDMLYRPAISVPAMRVEQFMCTPDAATFYTLPDGYFFPPTGGTEMFSAYGVPTPRMIYVLSGAREHLDQSVKSLGGFPVVLKVLGASRGIGVMRADSTETLYSLVDYVLSQGVTPVLSTYVPDAVHWRVIVVGDTAVAAYPNPVENGDFRTYGSQEKDEFLNSPTGDLADVAVAAVKCQRLEFGGVDVLAHPSGRHYVLESNFPCFFAQPQTVADIDVAGAMLNHLIRKAERIAGR